MKDEMLIVALCEKMHWTYEDYLDSPEWFIELALKKIEIDFKKEKGKSNVMNRR